MATATTANLDGDGDGVRTWTAYGREPGRTNEPGTANLTDREDFTGGLLHSRTDKADANVIKGLHKL
jgi:hypothetical protein